MRESILTNLKNDVSVLKSSAKNLGLSDNELKNIFNECLSNLKNEISTSSKPNSKAQKLCRIFNCLAVLFILFAIFVYILLNVHQPTSSIVLRNVQGLTYPTLKIIRFLSVPIIKLLPSLSDLYDESCLVENPYFYVADMECWPCEKVNTVINATGNDAALFKSGTGTPFIIKSNQQLVSYKILQDLYNNNKNTLNSESRRIKFTHANINNLEDLFKSNKVSSNAHILWRINRMTPARIVRQIFPKPSFLPDRIGQSVERFIIIDGAFAAPYELPTTECSYVFVVQGSGERTVVLKPSKECSSTCKTVSVDLKESYVLWYNWWYWRPISFPTKNSTKPSITYINSYC